MAAVSKNKTSPFIPDSAFKGFLRDSENTSKFGFPSDEVSEKQKQNDPKWSLEWAQAIFSQYTNNQTLFGASQAWQIEINRKYGRGLQDTNKYRKQLLGLTDNEGAVNGGGGKNEREGWMNISWDVISEIPRLKRVFQGLIDGTIFKPTTTAIDEKSSIDRETMMWTKWLDKVGADQEAALVEVAGGVPEGEKYLPESIDELKMLRDHGGLRLPAEMNFDKALKSVFYESNYDKLIQPLLAEDLFENNVMCVRDVVNPFTQKVEQKYVDIARMIAPYSRETQYTDMPYFGVLTDTNVKQVAAETGLAEELIKAIGETYDNFGNNSTLRNLFNNVDNLDQGDTNWLAAINKVGDAHKVVVAEFEWLSKNKKTFLAKEDRQGQRRFVEKKENGNTVTEYITVYKCKWLVGTDIVWDYGKAFDIPYDKQQKKPTLSGHVVRLTGKSLVESLIPMADMYCINWFKLQNALAMAPPAGLAMEWQAMQNMMLQGQKLSPKDVVKLRMQTGSFLYKSTNIIGRPNTPHGMPFQELEGGIGRQFNEFVGLFQIFENLAQKVTGFTDVASAQNPDPNAPVKTTEMSYNATINALRPFFNALAFLKQRSAQNIVRRIQVIAKWNKKGYEAYAPILGDAGLEVIKITADHTAADLGIHVEIINDLEQRNSIEQALLMAMKPQDGGPGLTVSEYMFVKRMLNDGNTKLAELWLAHLENKARKQKDKSLKLNSEAQGQEAMKQQQMKDAAEAMKRKEEHQYKMQEIALEGVLKQDQIFTTTEGKMVESVVNKILETFANQQQQAQEQQTQAAEQSMVEAPDLAMGQEMVA